MEQQHDQRVAENGWSYASFVRGNPTGARALENLLQYSGFFAPARFAERDLAIESGYAAARLAALAHDRILLGVPLGHGVGGRLDGTDQMHAGVSSPGSGMRLDPKSRNTSVAAFAERMRIALAMIAHVQVVAEKLAGQHGGGRRRRQAILYLETLKAICRLLLLAFTHEMVVGGGAYAPGRKRSPQRRDQSKPRPWREVDLSGRRLDRQSELSDDCPPSPGTTEVYTGRRSGVRLVVPPRASVVWSGRGRSSRVGVGRAVASCDGLCAQRKAEGGCSACRVSVGSRGLNGTALEEPETTADGPDRAADDGVSCAGGHVRLRRREVSASSGGNERGCSQAWLMAGEVVHILRPLVYCYSWELSGERSWRPWLTSLGMDALAYACTVRAGGGEMVLLLPVGSSTVPVLPYLDEEQAAELRRRKMQWFLYLMRSPAFELLTEPVSRGAAGVFEGVPLLGNLAGYALNMLLYVQRHHFYTSAS